MKKLIFYVAISTMLTSCATLFTGTRDSIQFNSTPSGARVEINNIERGKTPVMIPVQRSINGKLVSYKLKGYETKTFELQTIFNPVTILNILGFWFIGFGVDLATGSIIKYNPKIYDIELELKEEIR